MPNKRDEDRDTRTCDACGLDVSPREIVAYGIDVADPAVKPEDFGGARPEIWICNDCQGEFESERCVELEADVLSRERYFMLRDWVESQAQLPNTNLDLSTQIDLLREQLGGLLAQLEGIHEEQGNPEGYWVAGNVDLSGARTAMNRTGGAL